MNALGHNFKLQFTNDVDYILEDYICLKCSCIVQVQYIENSVKLYMWIPFKTSTRHHFGKLITCDEYIIKNIIE